MVVENTYMYYVKPVVCSELYEQTYCQIDFGKMNDNILATIVFMYLSFVLTLSRWNIIGKKISSIYKPMYSWITPNGKSMMCWPLFREDIFPK